jgi:acyl-CoA synthetase (NDP forming)
VANLLDNVSALFAPSTIAVVGASERPGPGRQVLDNLTQIGYSGAILPVNPKYDSILGLPCYPSLAAAKETAEEIDAVAILLGRDRVLPVLEEAAGVGIGAAWAFASGFRESGPEGTRLQDRVTELCRERGIALCGPNCVGFVNPAASTAAFSAPISPSIQRGQVAAVAQSGSIAMALINSARGIGFRTVVSSGNEAVLDCADYIGHFVDDPETRVILAFIEEIRRPRQFIEVAERARAAGKPLIVLKVGRSGIARRATVAHTGALAGEDAVYDAVFRRHGILRVHDLDEMLETAEAFVRLDGDLPAGPAVGMLTVSGGEISLIADLAEGLVLEFPQWSEATQAAFAEVLPEYASLENPLDAWGSGRIEETYAACVDAAANDDVDLLMISQDGPIGLAAEQVEQFSIVARATAAARRRTGKPILAFSHLAGGLDPTLRKLFSDAGVPFLQGTREGLLAAEHLVEFVTAQGKTPPREPPRDPEKAAALCGDRVGRVDEIASKAILSAYGIPGVAERLCITADDAVRAAEAMAGPVALKIVSEALPHKTDVDGVALGIEGEDDVRRAFAAMVERAASHVGPEAVEGVVVQQMISDAVAEVIVGISTDPTFGHVIVFGLGGISVELLEDRALAIPPLTREDARTMIGETKVAGLLAGFRGSEAGDIDALADVLIRLSQIALDFGERVVSIDVNPLLVRPQGAGVVAVDALIEFGPPPGGC